LWRVAVRARAGCCGLTNNLTKKAVSE
jgi:hypothetical protein